MANRVREDERNEKIIRGLLKLPANRRCINCNNPGPQYVCTNFWTFICTDCSGVHRQFTHRVKSISMAKFTPQEVTGLQEGGNERAKEVYFKEWDPQRHSFPDRSNNDRLRDFIKHVYVDRRYTGERSSNRSLRMKGDKEDFNANRRAELYHVFSRSLPCEDRNENSYIERLNSDGRNNDRNPRYSHETRSPVHDRGDCWKSPRRFEVVNEERPDGKIGNRNQNQRLDSRQLPDAVQMSSERPGQSHNHQKDTNSSIPPIVRPVSDILGNDVPPLQVGDLPKLHGAVVPENSSEAQRTASSCSIGTSDSNSVELKRANSVSLINFNMDAEPAAVESPRQTFSRHNENWASFGVTPHQNVLVTSTASSSASVLEQLSAPGSVPPGDVSLASSVDNYSKINDAQQLQQHQPNLPITYRKPPNPNSPGSLVAPNMQGTLTAPAAQPSQGAHELASEMGGGVLLHASSEAKPSGRKELPEGLFTSICRSAPSPFQGRQRAPNHGLSYGLQYPLGGAIEAFPQPSRPVNPFDVNEPSPAHTATFTSMESLQRASPNLTINATLLRSASLGTPQWMSQQRAYYPLTASASPPYMAQQGLSNIPRQAPSNSFSMGDGGYVGTRGDTSGMAQQLAARHAQPGSQNNFCPFGGNPFG